ncbi:MAG TPA: SET domain-containing protein-lysine N-methyltransferase [Gemmatimonadaceae bacterium]|nr:SET domain-containing protein-lysine N-methyltransferase [Gemmatimonadaceae bacterium]
MPTASQSFFEIRSSPIQGRGAFATRRIRKGTRLIEYVGERISHAEADRRYDDDGMKRHHTFLFTLNNRTVIDAGVDGNEARFINHSCSPNCEAVIDSGHIYIESIKTIEPGAELVYDYQYERAPDADESDEARYPCRCGSPNCRGTILAPPKRKRAAASAKRGKGASKRKKKAASKKKTPAKRKRAATKRSGAGAKRGTSAARKRTKTSATGRGSASKRGKKSTTRSKVSPNRLKAAARRRRSA